MADRRRGVPLMRMAFEMAVLEVGGRATAGLMVENDLPAHWSADVIARHAKLAVLRAEAGSAADRD